MIISIRLELIWCRNTSKFRFCEQRKNKRGLDGLKRLLFKLFLPQAAAQGGKRRRAFGMPIA
jgi:hypothetical protein